MSFRDECFTTLGQDTEHRRSGNYNIRPSTHESMMLYPHAARLHDTMDKVSLSGDFQGVAGVHATK